MSIGHFIRLQQQESITMQLQAGERDLHVKHTLHDSQLRRVHSRVNIGIGKQNSMNLLTADQSIVDFTDPFKKDSVTRITFEIHNYKSSLWRDGKSMEAHIHFKSNTTSGTQSFFDDDFPLLVKKVQDFVNHL